MLRLTVLFWCSLPKSGSLFLIAVLGAGDGGGCETAEYGWRESGFFPFPLAALIDMECKESTGRGL